MTTAALVLAADFLRTRFRLPGWTLASMLAALFLAGGNAMIVEFGVIGQAYGLALFLIVAAFRCAILAVERGSALLSGLTGLSGGSRGWIHTVDGACRSGAADLDSGCTASLDPHAQAGRLISLCSPARP